MKKPYIIIIIVLIVGLGFVFSQSLNSKNINQPTKSNIETKDGIQYIAINAKGGYSPKVSTAKAGIPTKIIVKTNGTYDCSVSLKIQSIGFEKILEQTAEEVIDIGIPVAGAPLRGVCSMGMYNFVINFI